MPSLASQVVQDLYAAFAQKDLAKVFSLLSPAIELTQSPALPWGGSYRGHAGAQDFFGKLTAQISSTVTIERFIDSTAHVTVIGWTEGRVTANGASFRVPIAHVWEVQAGLAVRAQFLIDDPLMLSALRA